MTRAEALELFRQVKDNTNGARVEWVHDDCYRVTVFNSEGVRAEVLRTISPENQVVAVVEVNRQPTSEIHERLLRQHKRSEDNWGDGDDQDHGWEEWKRDRAYLVALLAEALQREASDDGCISSITALTSTTQG